MYLQSNKSVNIIILYAGWNRFLTLGSFYESISFIFSRQKQIFLFIGKIFKRSRWFSVVNVFFFSFVCCMCHEKKFEKEKNLILIFWVGVTSWEWMHVYRIFFFRVIGFPLKTLMLFFCMSEAYCSKWLIVKLFVLKDC